MRSLMNSLMSHMMKFVLVFCLHITFFLFDCKTNKNESTNNPKHVELAALQDILDSSKVNGTILLYDSKTDVWHTNSLIEANKGVIPASTFKIPHSIIGLELGLLKDQNSIFQYDGSPRGMNIWEQDLTLKQAFQYSCVPCYQEMARKIGVDRMSQFIEHLEYGHISVDSLSIDNFWLFGDTEISAVDQIMFLRKLYDGDLQVKSSTRRTLLEILKTDESKSVNIYAKTGLGLNPNGDIGWYVGFLELDGQVIYFASRITPNQRSMDRALHISLRKEVTMDALDEIYDLDYRNDNTDNRF